jgi:hypothetical protein
MSTTAASVKEKAIHELKEGLVVSFYLWVVFALLEAHKSVILAEEHVDFAAHGMAVINAVALGKFLLVLRSSGLGRGAGNKPLIYPTILRSALLAWCLLAARFSKIPWWATSEGGRSSRVSLRSVEVRGTQY